MSVQELESLYRVLVTLAVIIGLVYFFSVLAIAGNTHFTMRACQQMAIALNKMKELMRKNEQTPPSSRTAKWIDQEAKAAVEQQPVPRAPPPTAQRPPKLQ